MAEYKDRKLEIIAGQAYNNAAEDARTTGNIGNKRYFFQQYVYHLKMIPFTTKQTLDILAVAMDNPKFLEKIDELSNIISEK